MATTQQSQSKNIVIVGGGIIGSTTAYFLSHHENFDKERDSITLLEATEIAGGASGKAGGLLALWAYPRCIVPLSFRLHGEVCVVIFFLSYFILRYVLGGFEKTMKGGGKGRM